MADLARRGPLGQKAGRGAKVNRRKRDGLEDMAYLEKVRGLNCIVCAINKEPQLTPTTAHHPIHGRFSQRKASDHDAIPLCDCHHQGQIANSKTALHREPAKWKSLYGEDVSYIDATKKIIEGG